MNLTGIDWDRIMAKTMPSKVIFQPFKICKRTTWKRHTENHMFCSVSHMSSKRMTGFVFIPTFSASVQNIDKIVVPQLTRILQPIVFNAWCPTLKSNRSVQYIYCALFTLKSLWFSFQCQTSQFFFFRVM